MHQHDAWLIGLVRSRSFEEIPQSLSPQPIFTAQSLLPWNGYGAADPFAIWVDGKCYVFFEMLVRGQKNAVIAVASSCDLMQWQVDGIAIQEAYHLSYPFVFEHAGQRYMMPESKSQRRVDLYRAVDFPLRWEKVGPLIHGRVMDASLIEHQGRYWMFAGWHSYWMRLFYANSPLGPWKSHWQPIARLYSKRDVRPGGRPVKVGPSLIRFAQDNRKYYGHQLRAMQITKLNRLFFREQAWGSTNTKSTQPFLEPNPDGWFSRCIHHLDIGSQEKSGEFPWIGVFDGY